MPLGFGLVKPQSTGVRDGDMPKFGDLSMQEKLLMLGATLRGDQQTAMSIPMLAAARAKQAAEQEWRSGLTNDLQGVPMLKQAAIKAEDGTVITDAFGPQYDTVQGSRPTLRDLVPKLMEGMNRGYNVEPIVNLLDKTGPSIKYEGGLRYDERDPSSAPGYIPKMRDGEEPVFDRAGNIVGIRNMAGSLQALADTKTVETSAVEGAKAKYDLVDVPMSDGTTVKLPRNVALDRLGGGNASVPPPPAPPNPRGPDVQPAGGPAPQFGRTQTPQDRLRVEGDAKERDAYNTDAAKMQAERDLLRPKALAALNAMNAKDKVVDAAINRALQRVGAWSAGPGALLSAIPGTPAKDLQADLEMIKSNLGFDELQTMRDNSPTGGALGQVAVQELETLRATLSSLDQAQSPEALTAALKRVAEIRKGSSGRRQEAFRNTYDVRRGGPSASPASGGGYSAADKARAAEILRQRRAARGQ